MEINPYIQLKKSQNFYEKFKYINHNRISQLKLPGNEEIDEVKLMIDFCSSFSDISLNELLTTHNDHYKILHDVKNIIRDKDLINEAVERDIAVEWCRENNIDYIE